MLSNRSICNKSVALKLLSGCDSVKGAGVFPGKATLASQPATLGLQGGGELPANQRRGEGRKSFSSRAPFTHTVGRRADTCRRSLCVPPARIKEEREEVTLPSR